MLDFAAAWWGWVSAAALQSTALLAAAWILDALVGKRAWPQILTAAWLAALARFFLPVGLTSPVSLTRPLGDAARTLTPAPPESDGLAAAVMALWALGAAALLAARCVRRALLARRLAPVRLDGAWRGALRRCAREAGLARAPRAAVLPGLTSPAVFGQGKPDLVLPPGALARKPTRRDEHALLHELVHVRHRDTWLDEILAAARALFWFNPLAWVAVKRLHDLAETRCDLTVARLLGAEARDYRDTLLLAARAAPGFRAASNLRGFLGVRGGIIGRIERLDAGRFPSERVGRGAGAACLALLAACVVPMASSRDLRAEARQVLAAARAGEAKSCFSLQAAAVILAADPDNSPKP